MQRRRWIAVAVVLVLVIVASRSLDRAMPVYYYRVVDERTVVVGSITGPGAWTRVTGVTETASTVTVSVSSLVAPLPGASAGRRVEYVLTLREPLDDRAVIDGSSGLAVPRTRCLPPSYLAPGCT